MALGKWMVRVGETLQRRYTGQDQPFRLKVKWFDDPVANFYVSDRVVTDPPLLTFNHPGSQPDKQPPYIKQLFDITGVLSVSLSPYEIRVWWGEVFSHNEIVPQVEEVLRKAFTK